MITVTIWHNVARDGEGRPTGMLDGYQPGDPVVRVFTYQADPAGRDPEQIAEEAFAICNGHPSGAGGADLSRRYYQRELRSLSFPGNRPCCPRSCCTHRSVVWLSLDAETEGPVKAGSWRERARRVPAGLEMGR
jgi:hypothetical protein